MDFIESIFSIIPLLMIVLFFVRLAAVSKKKNKPKPLNTIPPADVNEPQFPRYSSGPEALNTLAKTKNNKPSSVDIIQTQTTHTRLSNLPELKKAVIWAEILGKPKGLD